MGKKYFWFFIILVIVLIGLGIWVGKLFFGGGQNGTDSSPYSAVYLSTGDIYFGKLSWSPSPHMDGVWYLQKGTASNGSPQYGIAPFTGAFWGPIDEIYFNQSQIIFWTNLRSDSPVARALANPALFEEQLPAGQQQQPPSVSIPATGTPDTVPQTNAQK